MLHPGGQGRKTPASSDGPPTNGGRRRPMSCSKAETPRPIPLIRHEPVAHSSHSFEPVDPFTKAFFWRQAGRGVLGPAPVRDAGGAPRAAWRRPRAPLVCMAAIEALGRGKPREHAAGWARPPTGPSRVLERNLSRNHRRAGPKATRSSGRGSQGRGSQGFKAGRLERFRLMEFFDPKPGRLALARKKGCAQVRKVWLVNPLRHRGVGPPEPGRPFSLPCRRWVAGVRSRRRAGGRRDSG
jgi:hypothetical protein